MTQLPLVRFFQRNKKVAEQISTMNARALMVFLLLFLVSTLVHADHLIEQGTNVEQIECYLCHQGIDTPPELPSVQLASIVSYCSPVQAALSIVFKRNYFVQPQLRAPPTFQ